MVRLLPMPERHRNWVDAGLETFNATLVVAAVSFAISGVGMAVPVLIGVIG